MRPVTADDLPAIRSPHARAFGPGRFARTAYRIRESADDISRHCRVCLLDDTVIAAVRFTPIEIGGRGDALLLGPLAVEPAYANRGYGRGLVARALDEARSDGIALVLLVGDEPYYGRLGFKCVPRGRIRLPGPVDDDRLLAAELKADAGAAYSGEVRAAR
jgi:predicted N-acetyltransferase YhbS